MSEKWLRESGADWAAREIKRRYAKPKASPPKPPKLPRLAKLKKTKWPKRRPLPEVVTCPRCGNLKRSKLRPPCLLCLGVGELDRERAEKWVNYNIANGLGRLNKNQGTGRGRAK